MSPLSEKYRHWDILTHRKAQIAYRDDGCRRGLGESNPNYKQLVGERRLLFFHAEAHCGLEAGPVERAHNA